MVSKSFQINGFTKPMSLFFKMLFEQGYALVYFADVLLLSNFKEHMFQLILYLLQKIFFMILKVKFVRHKIGYHTNKPIH